MKSVPFFQVDAFADTPFQGNPAAICLLKEALDTHTMLSIAQENNLSETAFVIPVSDGFQLRWFTPQVEVELCGHATLATAHILWQKNLLAAQEPARFHTKSGLLTVVKEGDWMTMDFPKRPIQTKEAPESLLKALGVRPIASSYSVDRYLLEVATEEEVIQARPDMSLLKQEEMVVLTSLSKAPYDFISRSFAPSHGVDEDPVTGSSHSSLVPYYAEKLHKKHLHAYQASARGGELKVSLQGARVLITGKAVTIIEGTLYIEQAN